MPQLESYAPTASHIVQIVADRGVYTETAPDYAKTDGVDVVGEPADYVNAFNDSIGVSLDGIA
jgi:hypothetical protein